MKKLLLIIISLCFIQKSISQNEKLLLDTGCKELLQSVKENNINKVIELLKTTNPDCIYTGDGEPRSPLVAAARKGYIEMGKLLIESKANVEFHAKDDESPLMASAGNGHIEFVKLLIENNADINNKIESNGTALLVASKNGHIEVVKYLVSKKAEINAQVNSDGTPLICAVKNGDYPIAKFLLENGANPNLKSAGDESPMYYAIASKNKSMVLLLKKYQNKK